MRRFMCGLPLRLRVDFSAFSPVDFAAAFFKAFRQIADVVTVWSAIKNTALIELRATCTARCQRLGYSPPQMSSGWRYARASPFILLRETTQSLPAELLFTRSS